MIDWEDRGGVASVTMAYGKANVMDLEFLERLNEVLDQIESSDSAAAVLTGRGSIFSAGVDLRRILSDGASYIDAFIRQLMATFERVFFFPKPLIAAVNGHAIAGGCIFVCACDFRLGSQGRIGVPELRIGVPFPAIGLEILRFAIPPHRFQDVVYGGETYDGARAVEIGFFDRWVAPKELLSEAFSVAERYAQYPPAAFRLSKEEIRRPVQDFLERHGRHFDERAHAQWVAPDTIETIRRYVDSTLG